ncbi:MAG: amidohydrolase [Deltaproteobacteria bacterium]|nr:amidohydrolase [Deltaproteobacteria bacterium]
METKEGIKRTIQRLVPSLVSLSHDISSHPETALKEYRTRDAMCEFLHRHGFDIRKGAGGLETSFIATSGTATRPAVAYIAEMDALPDIGHACGHNVNSAISIGAAVALSKAVSPAGARIALVGTPAEETGYGKPVLIEHGVFRHYDVAMMSHASTKRMSYRYMLALKKIKIRFRGRAAHAASYPEEGRDALSALILTINNIDSMRQSFRRSMRANGIITRGGTAPNIIPDFAEAYYFIRAISLEELGELMGWVRDAVDGAAMATGTRAEITEEGYTQYPFYVNRELTDIHSGVLESLGLKQSDAGPYAGIGSSDIGQLSYVLPTLHTYTPIGAGAHIHTAAFRRLAVSGSADRAIAEGALVLALTGRTLIKDPALLKRIRHSHHPPAVFTP